MQVPNIDLTDAARAYGLSYVPPVREADWLKMLMEGDSVAGFSQQTKDIEVFPSLFHQDNAYSEQRFASVGVGPLNATDAAKFILAHELWHARQDELNPDALRWGDRPTSTYEHDTNWFELDADRHAAKVYQLVKIGD